MDEDDRPASPRGAGLAQGLGGDLSRLSLTEIDERIAALKEEIGRLEAARAKKEASRAAADAAFKL